MAQIDIHHPPSGGFQNGGWYWDPSANEARQYYNGNFGGAGIINNPNQQGYGQAASSAKNPSPGSSSGSDSSPLGQINQAIQDSASKLMGEVQQKWGQYTSGNPFRVDQVLADKTKEAKEQIDPYYNQVLGDYLLGATRKINKSSNDASDLLSELTQTTASQDEATQNNLQKSIENEQNKYATHGLINSGEALANTGEQVAGANNTTSQNDLTANFQAKRINSTAANDIAQTNEDAKTFATQNAQNQYTSEQQRAADLTKEAGQQYIAGFQGTLPPELQAANGFDALKSLGIYG